MIKPLEENTEKNCDKYLTQHQKCDRFKKTVIN